jgi:ABC-type branched-subunit amino acid transport system ATPase component
LLEKAHAKSGTLSGGQKRKLSVGIALIGDSKIVILYTFHGSFPFFLFEKLKLIFLLTD